MYILSGNKRYDDNGVETGATYRLNSAGINVTITTGEKNVLYMASQDIAYDSADEVIDAFKKILAVAAEKHGLANLSDLELEKPKPKRAPRKKAEPKVEEEAKE